MSLRISATPLVEDDAQAVGDSRRLLVQAAPGESKHLMARHGELQIASAIALERRAGPMVLPSIGLHHWTPPWPARVHLEPEIKALKLGSGSPCWRQKLKPSGIDPEGSHLRAATTPCWRAASSEK
jgi:hypothetical protein